MNSSRSYIWLVAVLLFLASCSKNTDVIVTPPPPPPPPVTLPDNDPLLLGNPTNAVTSVTSPENYLKNNGYYKISYSSSRGIPVWVAWHLQADLDIGVTARQDDFRADPALPNGWYQVQDNSYSGSGFDRGHNCPSADRTSSIPANSSTFLMTNIIPQSPRMNQGPWANLEDFTRSTLVGSNKEAYIFMGNYGQGGYNTNNLFYAAIDSGRVTVPAYIWKVIIVLPKGTNDLTRIDTSATVLAVNMPNDNRLYLTGGGTVWRNYVTTISNLEQQSGNNAVMLNLLQSVAANVRTYLKAKLYQ
jgi:endonuclease G, mitochondrial